MTQEPLNKQRGGEAGKFQVRLTDDQREWLGVLAESTGVTPSEFIRASIDLARKSGDPDPVGSPPGARLLRRRARAGRRVRGRHRAAGREYRRLAQKPRELIRTGKPV